MHSNLSAGHILLTCFVVDLLEKGKPLREFSGMILSHIWYPQQQARKMNSTNRRLQAVVIVAYM